MKNELIKSLTNNFEDYSQTTDNGIEFWSKNRRGWSGRNSQESGSNQSISG